MWCKNCQENNTKQTTNKKEGKIVAPNKCSVENKENEQKSANRKGWGGKHNLIIIPGSPRWRQKLQGDWQIHLETAAE